MSNLYRFCCLFLLCCTSLLMTAQTPNPNPGPCYVRLEDASGFNTDAFQAELEAAACSLAAAIKSDSMLNQFVDSFHVYDFGFYLHQEHSDGSYPEAMQQKIAEVSALSPYYLIFGKETGRDGVYQKLWVDVKLPSTGDFFCLDKLSDHIRSDISFKIQYTANKIHENNDKSPAEYYLAEVAAMDSLRVLVAGFVECCDPANKGRGGNGCGGCLLNEESFAELLMSEYDFVKTETKLISKDANTNRIIDATLEVSGIKFKISQEIQKYLEVVEEINPNTSHKVFEIDFSNHCTTFDDLLEMANKDTSTLKFVVFLLPNGNSFIKTIINWSNSIEENGSGKIYLFSKYGEFLEEGYGKKYHGIYFKSNSDKILRIAFHRGEVELDFWARYCEFYISEKNIQYLKSVQRQTMTKGAIDSFTGKHRGIELGGIYGLGEKRELFFDYCDWCEPSSTETSMVAYHVLDIEKYDSFLEKQYLGIWHTHPDDGDFRAQIPSGFDGSGDFHVYRDNSSIKWRDTSATELENIGFVYNGQDYRNNIYKMIGRVGLIAADHGITVYKHTGQVYTKVSKDGKWTFPKLKYNLTGTNSDGTLWGYKAAWIPYNLSRIYVENLDKK